AEIVEKITKFFWTGPLRFRYTWSCPYILTPVNRSRENKRMNHPAKFPGLRGMKCTLAASLTLLTTGALFAQSADQSDVSALKAQMEKMQRQYEQRISAMEAQMKSLESKADSGTILNTRILTDSDGKGGPPAPVLTEDFLKSLTRNFVFAMYARAGFMFN